MIPARYIDYTFGKHRIFYVPESGEDLPDPPIVNGYFPDKLSKDVIEMEHLDTGLYYVDAEFDRQGTHLFVFFEGTQKTGLLYALVKPY
jgi:hypothetical protein